MAGKHMGFGQLFFPFNRRESMPPQSRHRFAHIMGRILWNLAQIEAELL